MATKSIYKTVSIKDRYAAGRLVSALEKTEARNVPEVKYSRPHSDASVDDLRKMFGKE